MEESATPPTVYQVHGHTAPGGDARVRAATQTIPVDGCWGSAPSGAPGPADLLHQNLRRFGTVYNTLAAVCDVDGTVVPVAPPAG
ncbi:hypothetical protein [Kitasatospora sp. NPDC001132]